MESHILIVCRLAERQVLEEGLGLHILFIVPQGIAFVCSGLLAPFHEKQQRIGLNFSSGFDELQFPCRHIYLLVLAVVVFDQHRVVQLFSAVVEECLEDRDDLGA